MNNSIHQNHDLQHEDDTAFDYTDSIFSAAVAVAGEEMNRITTKQPKNTGRTTAEIAAYLEEKSIKSDAAKVRKAYRLANPKPPSTPTLTNKLRYETLVKYNARCLLCGATPDDGIRVDVDHVKPVSKYPELVNDPDNLQVLCEACNSGKSNRTEDDFR